MKDTLRIILLLLLNAAFVYAHPFENSLKSDCDSVDQKYVNWFNKDPESDQIVGVSAEKAYTEILKNKTSSTVIVAVIDSGIDIDHEDINDNIWINEDEIAGNGVDDDGNGYIDDIHGWNFLGNSEGENIDYESYELTRLYKAYTKEFGEKNPSEIKQAEKKDYEHYLKVKQSYLEALEKAQEENKMLQNFDKNFQFVDNFMTNYLGKSDYSVAELKAIESDEEQVVAIKDMLLNLYENGFSKKDFIDYKEYNQHKLEYHLNPDYNPRKIIGDNPENIKEAHYGNNDVEGSDASHGTHVAGIIAAERNNEVGINGIADNVKIMAIRAVPNGDERDKDVANAIKYAVNNGARIINMSFGKDFSPQKEAVDLAVKLAEEKGVLLIHAAGNDATNNDEVKHFPLNRIDGRAVKNWITVGATNLTPDKHFVANFSNYGARSVDIFAPGEEIYSLEPKNGYVINSGTSMASPVVAGVAALIMSYYPDFNGQQVKEIIMDSATNYKRLRVYMPGEETLEKNPKKVKFKKLSVSGGVVNAYEAVKMAEKMSGDK